MTVFLEFLKQLLREPSVRALLIGLVVNGLIALVGKIPNLPPYVSTALLGVIQAIAAGLELVILGWVASKAKALYALLTQKKCC